MEVEPMKTETKNEIEDVIAVMARKASKEHTNAGAAMQYAQASLNLAHALATLANVPDHS
jgi:hypothetical protein